LNKLDTCFYGCKHFKEPLYKEREINGFPFKIKELSGKYLFHLSSVHGLPPEFLIDIIANKLYPDEEDRESMRECYKWFK